MAIVLNWAKPLEDSLLQMLSKPDLNYREIEKIRGIAAMLDGAMTSDDVERRLAEHVERLEQRYQSALQRLEKAESIPGVEAVIRDLQQMEDYRDADQRIEAAKQRIQALRQQEVEAEARRKRRKRRNALIAAAAVVALIAGLVVYSSVARNRVLKTIADARAQVEAGQTEAATQVIFDLAKAGKQGSTFNTLYELSEAVLERTAADQGYEAAFGLYDSLLESAKGAIRRDDFWSHAKADLADGGLPGIERWELLTNIKSRQDSKGINGVDAETEKSVLNDCVVALCDEMAAGSSRDVEGWISAQRENFDAVRMDPEAALRLVYALHDAGHDAAGLFPDGINVDIPLAERVMTLVSFLVDDSQSPDSPDMTAVLPVAVEESAWIQDEDSGSRKDRMLYEVVCSKTDQLDERITGIQKNEDHYTVRLLPEYLFRIPEPMRAGTYSDCTALVCMQTSYLASGTATKVTEYSSGNSSKTGYLPSRTSREYRYCFSALDIVSMYDQGDISACSAFYVHVNSAQIEDQTWFNAHKEDSDLYSQKNMMGVFDIQTLKEHYGETVDSLAIYSILLQPNDDGQSDTEVDSHDAD